MSPPRVISAQGSMSLLLVLQLGPWSACGGDAAYGHSSRAVTCTDVPGNIASPGSSTCASTQPSSKVMCLSEATLTACRPSFLADWYFKGQDCYGHGRCGVSGCECKDGWHGQFCEVPPKCAGVMDRRDVCCASSVLDVSGGCCSPGSVLDASGACCGSGQVDVCGVCGGSSWTVDVRVSLLRMCTPAVSVGGWGGLAAICSTCSDTYMPFLQSAPVMYSPACACVRLCSTDPSCLPYLTHG
jgi:hypothetical protein